LDQVIGYLALFVLVVCVCVKLLFDYNKIKEHEESRQYKPPKNKRPKESAETVDTPIENATTMGHQQSDGQLLNVETLRPEPEGVSVTSNYCADSKTLTMSFELPTTLKKQKPLYKDNIVQLNPSNQRDTSAIAKRITFINSRSASAKKMSRLSIYYDSKTFRVSVMTEEFNMLLEDFPLNKPYDGNSSNQLAVELQANVICFFDEASLIKSALTTLIAVVYPSQKFSIRLYDVKKQYYKYVPERPNSHMAVINAVKNVGLLEYGKQPDSNQLKCERTLLLNDFLFTRENALTIVVNGLDTQMRVMKCDVHKIQDLPANHIFLIDYDRLTENTNFVGTFESLTEADVLHSFIQTNKAYIIRAPDSTLDDCRLTAFVPETVEESLLYKDCYRLQYTAKAHTDRKRIQQTYLNGFDSTTSKLKLTLTVDYLATHANAGDLIHLKETSHIDCFKHGAFRLNFTDTDKQLLASTINSNKDIIELLWQASSRVYEAHIQSIDADKSQVSILFNFY
jgi:hypothetical protein